MLASLNEGLQEVERVATLSLNMVAGSWRVENEERGYQTLRARRNLANHCPDEVVDALLHAVTTDGVALSKRYYSLKKAILRKNAGLERFTWADRNAPLPVADSQEQVTWPEAVQLVVPWWALPRI